MAADPQIIAIAGLPGSGKSTLVRDYVARGYTAFDDPGATWDETIAHIAQAARGGTRLVVAEIMFCTAEWRAKLESALEQPVHWHWFRNDPWQCSVNCLYRLMVQLDERPLMDMLFRIAELSPQYTPPADALPVVAADQQLRPPATRAA